MLSEQKISRNEHLVQIARNVLRLPAVWLNWGTQRIRKPAILALASALLILSAPRILAQSPAANTPNPEVPPPFALSISPSVVEMAIQPGKVVTQAFLIENNGSVDLTVRPVLRDFESDGETGTPRLQPNSTFPYASLVNSQIELNKPFALAAGQSEQLVLEVKPSELAEERDWYFMLFLETTPDTSNTVLAQSGAATTGYIGANVLVRITHTNQIPLQWDVRFELPRFIDSLQKLEFTALVSNQSETVAVPDMTVTILRNDQEILSEETVLPDRILAKSSRRMYAQQARKDDPRSFEGVPFRFAPVFALGKYTVRASIRNNMGGPLVVEQEFWALPFSLIIAVVVVLFLLLFLFLRKQRVHISE